MIIPYIISIFAIGVFATTGPNVLGTDLTILINNDLIGIESSFANSGILLLDPSPLDRGILGCSKLSESLWAPETHNESIQMSLNFLVYQKTYERDQLFWISPLGNVTRTIDSAGKISNGTYCGLRLPVICSHSAPFSGKSFQNTSTTWQINVNSNNQSIIGFRDKFSFRFHGVRYANQPRRWTHTKVYNGTGNTISALEFGAICLRGKTAGDEDCHFLNIWTPYLPATPSRKVLKPVMFWIHGGAFTGGSGSDALYDGGNLASRGDAVVVSINYRLGTLGFLALDDGQTNGNFGLADQITALDWVRKNIADFGGDKDRITIFGQSAGAGSVRALLASPVAKGKFAGAIMMSNLGGLQYGTTYSHYYTIPEAMKVAGKFILNESNCSVAISPIDCLRSVPARTIATLSTAARYLVVDGTYITTTDLPLNDPSKLTRVPLMMGYMRDDGAAMIGYPAEGENLTAFLNESSFTSSITSTNLFPVPNGSNKTLNIFNTTAHVATDGIFRCVAAATAFASLQNDVFPSIYLYEFNRSYQMTSYSPNSPVCDAPKTSTHLNGDPNQEYFKCHSGELHYVFGNLGRLGLPFRDENDLPFSQFILDAWSAFARTGNPTPDKKFLQARGFLNSSWEIQRHGGWESLQKRTWFQKRLEWPPTTLGQQELEQCKTLGLPLNMSLSQSPLLN